MTFVQAEIAKLHGKPFRIALKKGVEIPSDFLIGVDDHKIAVWETAEELSEAFIELVGEADQFELISPYVKN